MNWREIERGLLKHGLFVMGTLDEDGTHIALIGAGPAMWAHFIQSVPFHDQQPDPLDRWSKSILQPLARELGGEARFPSDGPPYAPFIRWAEASGRFWQSPVGMLVHDTAGLMVSMRGALLVEAAERPKPISAPSPCTSSCFGHPCRTACPVDALSAEKGYNVAACHQFLDTKAGQDCLQTGCKARRACPISQSFGRDPDQSAFHMRSFHPT